MKRLPAMLLALAASACGELPTQSATAPISAPPSPHKVVTFFDNGQFNFASYSACVAENTLSILCNFKVENAGSRTAVGLSLYGYWNADAVCVHAKTGKAAPARQQPANPQRLYVNVSPAAGLSLTNGEATVNNLRLPFSTVGNPCDGKGPYTVVQWVNIVPFGYLLIAYDFAAPNGYATAEEYF
jgi:hypothetical protein